jgi:hypothetical protein
MDQDLQGKIGRFTLPEILQLIAASRKTGTLGIQKEDDIVMVYFKKGKIIYGYGPRQAYHLGELLKEKGEITAEQLNDAVAAQTTSASSKRLGQILMEKKYIDRASLERILKSQIEELIYSLLNWKSGSFKFYENQFPTEEEVTTSITVENAILEGMRRLDEQNRINDLFPETDTVLALTPKPSDNQSEISLKSEEWNLLALIDGRRTIEEIIAVSPLPRHETLHRLAALKMAGLAAPAGKKRSDEDHLSSMADNLGRLLQEYLERKTSNSKGEKTTLSNLRDAMVDVSGDNSGDL